MRGACFRSWFRSHGGNGLDARLRHGVPRAKPYPRCRQSRSPWPVHRLRRPVRRPAPDHGTGTLGRFGRGVWGTALLLGLTGNVGYYLLVVLAVQRAGAPLTALVVGALPVTLAVAGTRGSAGRLRALVPALVLTVVGLTLVNISALTRAHDPARSPAWGLAAAAAALASWTWFGLGNARFLDAHPDIGRMLWASVLGIAGLAWTLPVIAGLLATGRPVTATNQPAGYLAGVLLLGILTSWVAAAAWNRAATALLSRSPVNWASSRPSPAPPTATSTTTPGRSPPYWRAWPCSSPASALPSDAPTPNPKNQRALHPRPMTETPAPRPPR